MPCLRRTAAPGSSVDPWPPAEGHSSTQEALGVAPSPGAPARLPGCVVPDRRCRRQTGGSPVRRRPASRARRPPPPPGSGAPRAWPPTPGTRRPPPAQTSGRRCAAPTYPAWRTRSAVWRAQPPRAPPTRRAAAGPRPRSAPVVVQLWLLLSLPRHPPDHVVPTSLISLPSADSTSSPGAPAGGLLSPHYAGSRRKIQASVVAASDGATGSRGDTLPPGDTWGPPSVVDTLHTGQEVGACSGAFRPAGS